MTIQDVANHFTGVKPKADGSYTANCPCCGAKSGHLSIKTGDNGSIIMYCIKCNADAKAIAPAVGLTMKDLRSDADVAQTKAPAAADPKPGSIERRRHIYRNEDGSVYAIKDVVKPGRIKNGVQHDKDCYWTHEEHGVTVNGQPKGKPCPVYHADVLHRLEETGKLKEIYIAEGEKDVETLNLMGIEAATTLPNGGGQTTWQPHFNKWFTGKVVYVLTDNDATGKQYGITIAMHTLHVAKTVKVIPATMLYSDAPAKFDISNIVQAVGIDDARDRLATAVLDAPAITQAEIDAMAAELAAELAAKKKAQAAEGAAPPPKQVTQAAPAKQEKSILDMLVSATELLNTEYAPPEYIVDGFIPNGLVVISAPPKIGKSWLCLQLADAVAHGADFMGMQCKQGNVVYMALEDGNGRIKSRMQASNVAESKSLLTICSSVENKIHRIGEGFLEQLKTLCESEFAPKLVIVDTLTRVKGLPVKGMNSYDSDSIMYAPLQQFCTERKICLMMVTHFRKNNGLKMDDPFELITGSTGIFGICDAAIAIAGKRGTPEKTLYITGRDIEQQELKVLLNAETHKWQVTGKATDVAESMKDAANRNPIARIVCKMLESQAVWRATSADILQAMADNNIVYDGDARTIGEDITGRSGRYPVDEMLRLYKNIGSNKRMIHGKAEYTFYKGQPVNGNDN